MLQNDEYHSRIPTEGRREKDDRTKGDTERKGFSLGMSHGINEQLSLPIGHIAHCCPMCQAASEELIVE